MIFNINMLDSGMKKGILREGSGCVIVTENSGGERGGHMDTMKETAEPGTFLNGLECGNIFSLTRGCGNSLLFL
jgi:hypothetical protein